MSRRRPRLILLPGMGADHRLFEPQRLAFPELDVPAWLDAAPAETLESYGHRFASRIDPRAPVYLGGVSFGGMVALEVARHVRPEAVLLIASARTGKSIPSYLRFLERLSRLLPGGALELSRPAWPLALRKLGTLSPEQRRRVLDMLRDTPVRFLRWASRAVADWSFQGGLACPVHQIHGEQDQLLPVQRVDPDRIIRGGGHLINLTHPAEVNAFLLQHTAKQ